MRRLLLWLAMRTFRLRHFRVSGSLNERVFASGDVLMTGSAHRIIFTVLKHREENHGNFELTFSEASGELIGVRPPRVMETTVGDGIYRREAEDE